MVTKWNETYSEKQLFQIAKNMKPATGAMSVFVGLNASNEELKLEKENVWAFASNEASTTFRVTFFTPSKIQIMSHRGKSFNLRCHSWSTRNSVLHEEIKKKNSKKQWQEVKNYINFSDVIFG